MREARGMESVRQWLKSPKNKRGRAGGSMDDGTRMMREGSLIRGTKVKEARVGQEGTLLAPIPGKRALRKNNLPLRGLYGNLCPQRMPQSKKVQGEAGSEKRLQVEGMSRPSWFQGLGGMACAKGKVGR